MRSGRSSITCVERAREAVERLLRQAVDQVDVDRARSRWRAPRRSPPCVCSTRSGCGCTRLLHLGVEVLHAEADAVEAQVGAARRSALGVDRARVDLDRVLAVRRRTRNAPQRVASSAASSSCARKSACRRPSAAARRARRRPAARLTARFRAPGSAGIFAALLVSRVMILLQAQ